MDACSDLGQRLSLRLFFVGKFYFQMEDCFAEAKNPVLIPPLKLPFFSTNLAWQKGLAPALVLSLTLPHSTFIASAGN